MLIDVQRNPVNNHHFSVAGDYIIDFEHISIPWLLLSAEVGLDYLGVCLYLFRGTLSHNFSLVHNVDSVTKSKLYVHVVLNYNEIATSNFLEGDNFLKNLLRKCRIYSCNRLVKQY